MARWAAAVKLGLLVRAEDRGLGIQTWEAWRALRPDVTVAVDVGALGRGFVQHFDRYPGAVVSPWDGHRLSDEAFDALRDVDVILSCETLYDWRLTQLGPATVVQGNPEFFKHATDPTVPHPSMWWAPSPWRFHVFPEGRRRLVPVPVALDRFCQVAAFHDTGSPPALLHVAGKPALADRNGTTALLMALRRVRVPLRIHIATQHPHLTLPRGLPKCVEVERTLGGTDNYWQLYDGSDVLVMPRRYGGLCLPVQEAMAAGLGVVMTDCQPNHWWPVGLISAKPGPTVKMPAGPIQLTDPDVNALHLTLERLSTDGEYVQRLRCSARSWAEAHSWDALLPVYRDELARAAQ